MREQIATAARRAPRPHRCLARLGAPLLSTLLVLAAIWVLIPLLPESSGWRFGPPYRLLYSALALGGGMLLFLMDARPLRLPLGSGHAVASVPIVYLGTVALLVALGAAVPQYERPKTAREEAASQVERGRAIFTSPNVGCFLCHAIGGGAASRGPDLAGLAGRAGARKPGMGAEEYLRESITNPGASIVPTYAPIMLPDLAQRLSPQQMDDLIAYLLTLK